MPKPISDRAIAEEFARAYKHCRKVMAEVGEEAVEYARQTGNYHDVTGNLRRSNQYEVSSSGLRVFNDAPYASDIESRGLDVISHAALWAEKKLRGED